MASVWANIDLWQSPKSKPQIFTFLSLLAVTNKVSSDEMSMAITGSLCPYLCTTNCGGGGGGQLLQWSWYFKKKESATRTEEKKNRRKDELIVIGLHRQCQCQCQPYAKKSKEEHVHGQKEFQGIVEIDLHGVVQRCHGHQGFSGVFAGVVGVLDAQDLLVHF